MSEILSAFLARSDEPLVKTKAKTPAPSAVTKATATLSATARAIVASLPSPVAKDAAPAPITPAPTAPVTGPKYVARAPRTPRAEPGTAAAVFQGAVRQVPEPEGAASAAAAFDEARAKREDGRYGVPITGGARS